MNSGTTISGKKVRELSSGSQSIALTAKEAGDALAIRDALEDYRRETGHVVTAIQAVTQYVAAVKVLGKRPEIPQGSLGFGFFERTAIFFGR